MYRFDLKSGIHAIKADLRVQGSTPRENLPIIFLWPVGDYYCILYLLIYKVVATIAEKMQLFQEKPMTFLFDYKVF